MTLSPEGCAPAILLTLSLILFAEVNLSRTEERSVCAFTTGRGRSDVSLVLAVSVCLLRCALSSELRRLLSEPRCLLSDLRFLASGLDTFCAKRGWTPNF